MVKQQIDNQTFSVTGMSCQNCVRTITERLSAIDGVRDVAVDLHTKQVHVTSDQILSVAQIRDVLPERYSVAQPIVQRSDERPQTDDITAGSKSKLAQLRPLFLILGYILVAAILLSYKDWSHADFMMDFMGLFFIVFSFFKMLDLAGFSMSFQMYDPLARAVPAYGYAYPFIETGLGLMFLMRYEVKIGLVVSLIVLGITTYGVTRTLLDKRQIKCACLGTALNLPMTEATFIENAIMITMAVLMLC